MAKVLISFLGTGPVIDQEKREYKSAKYLIDGKEYQTPFVSAALSDHLNVEKRIILGTAKSMWEEFYRYFAGKEECFEEDFFYELGDYSEKANHQTTDFGLLMNIEKKLSASKILILKYGLNEEELRYNISEVFRIESLLENNDEVYIDITHGFRSFPILAQQIIFYLKEISSKNINIKSFYYGMLDASRELGFAPIVDMKILLEMNDWLIGASEFKNNAEGSRIRDLLAKKDEKLAAKVDNFSKAVKINYAHEIKKQIEQLKKLDIEGLQNPEKMLLKEVFNDFLNRFPDLQTASSFQLELSTWYFKKKIYGSSYIILAEAILSFLVEKVDGANIYDKKIRDFVKYTINSILPKDVKEKEKPDYILFRKENGFELNKYKPLFGLYKSINVIRNNIAHNLNKRHNVYLDDIKILGNTITQVKHLFNS